MDGCSVHCDGSRQIMMRCGDGGGGDGWLVGWWMVGCWLLVGWEQSLHSIVIVTSSFDRGIDQ